MWLQVPTHALSSGSKVGLTDERDFSKFLNSISISPYLSSPVAPCERPGGGASTVKLLLMTSVDDVKINVKIDQVFQS